MNIKYLSLGFGLAISLSFIPVKAISNTSVSQMPGKSSTQSLPKSEIKSIFKDCIDAVMPYLQDIVKMKEKKLSRHKIDSSSSTNLAVKLLFNIINEYENVCPCDNYFRGAERVQMALGIHKIDEITMVHDIVCFILTAFRAAHHGGTLVNGILVDHAEEMLMAVNHLNKLVESW